MKIAIYTRKSVYTENSESIETQITLCKNYFGSKENTFEIFEDEGFSGGNTNRPAFKRMMNNVKLNKFDVVAIYKVDRISRNIVDFFKIYEELEKYNTKLISISEGFDPSTPGGKMMMIMLSAFADMERENIRQRVKDNMIALAKKGCFTGGFVPFGCTVEKKDGKSYLKIVDVDIIRLMFTKYLECGSLYSTQKYLLEHGIKTLTTRSSLGKLLRNPVYVESDTKVSTYLQQKGFEVVGNPNKKGYMTYGKTTNYPTLIVGKHKACIDVDIFLKVNMLLDKNKEESVKRPSKTYWLTDVLYCPFCGGKYQLVNSGRNTYYVCKNRVNRAKNEISIDTTKEKCKNNKYIKAVEIEEKVAKIIYALESKKDIPSYLLKNRRSTNNDEIEILEKQIKEIEKSISNLVEKLMLLSNVAATPVTKKIEELTKNKLDLESKLEDLKLQQLNDVDKTDLKEIQVAINNFKNLNDNKKKRLSVKAIFKKIVYNPFTDDIEITIN